MVTNSESLEWNVMLFSMNDNHVEKYNVLSNYNIKKSIKGIFLDEEKEKNLRENIRQLMMYQFWARTEYEIIVSDWPSSGAEEKIDVYYQIMLNFDAFIQYIVDHKKDFLAVK